LQWSQCQWHTMRGKRTEDVEDERWEISLPAAIVPVSI
jgi:hypothetical protein